MPELPPVTSTLLPWSPRTRSSSVGRAIRISRCGRSHRYTRQGPCHTAPTMSDTVQPGPGNVTRIGGSVYGQVISGDNNLQYQVRVEEGGIVNLGPRVDPRALPLPVVLRPRDFPSLVGRERELDVALAAIAAGAPVEVQGAAKTGKTVLLRYLAHRELPPSVPDGVVYLEVDGVPPADVLQSLFEAFHETDGAYKPTELRIRRAFQRTRALLLLDDATFDERAITRLLNALPRCVLVLTCLRRRFSADGAAIALGGLPAAAAMAVVERVLGRPLTGAEPPAAAELWHAVDGAPGWLALAAAQVAQGASTFEALAGRLRSATPAEALAAEVAASLTAEQQRAVALLAAVGGPLAAPHLGALTGIADVEAAMEPLASRQLVTTHSPSYSLATGLRPRPGTETVDAASLRQAAIEHFVAHAEANRHRPDRLAGDLDVCLGLLRWAVEQERWGSVVRLGRAIDGALALTRRWGAWEEALLAVRLAAGNLGDRGAEAWALHQLGTRALCWTSGPRSRPWRRGWPPRRRRSSATPPSSGSASWRRRSPPPSRTSAPWSTSGGGSASTCPGWPAAWSAWWCTRSSASSWRPPARRWRPSSGAASGRDSQDRPGRLRLLGRHAGGGLAPLGFGDRPGGVDQADVAERLWVVADHLGAADVDLLGQQADVVGVGGRPLEGRPCPVDLAGQRLRLGEPEGAQQEGALLALQPVGGAVAVDQAALVGEPLGDRVDGRLHARVVAGQEPRDRHHQVAGVQVVAVERLGVGAGGLAPAVLEDRGADLVAGGRPRPHADLGADQVGQGDRAVQRHPAHQLGVQEVAGLAADLPDALVLLPPAARRGVGGGDQEAAGGGVDPAELLVQALGRAEQLAVDVELALVPGAVADPHRPAAAPAPQVGQLPLGEVALAADPEHDLEVGPTVELGGGRAGQEPEELVGLVGAGGHPQGLHGEAGVPHPGVAVVPVPLAADRLGQRGGRGGHDRPGRLEGERLQHPAGVVHQLPPRALVALVHGRPGAPARDGVVEAAGDLLLGPDPRGLLPAPGVVQREAGRLSRPQGEPAGGGGAVDPEVGRGRQHQPVGAAAGCKAALHRLQQRVDQAVLRPRRVLDLHLDLPVGAGQAAQQHPRRAGAQLVATLVAADRQRVVEHRGPAPAPEGRLQRHRLVEVAAGGGRPRHADREMAGVVVEQAGEDRRPVEAGEAEPVHRPRPADQRGRAAVGEQGVVGDRQGAHAPAGPFWALSSRTLQGGAATPR